MSVCLKRITGVKTMPDIQGTAEITDITDSASTGDQVEFQCEFTIHNPDDFSVIPNVVFIIGYTDLETKTNEIIMEQEENFAHSYTPTISGSFEMPSNDVAFQLVVENSETGSTVDTDTIQVNNVGQGAQLSLEEINLFADGPYADEQIGTSVGVSNQGDEVGTANIEVLVDGQSVDSYSFDVDPGVTKTRSGPTIDPLDTGTHTISANMDGQSVSKEIEVNNRPEEGEPCKKSDFYPWEQAENMIPEGDSTVYYGESTDPYEPVECSFSELWNQFDRLEVYYDQEPIKIEGTSSTDIDNPPERSCEQQLKDWRDGKLVAAVWCNKDSRYYWVHYPAQLIPEGEDGTEQPDTEEGIPWGKILAAAGVGATGAFVLNR